MTTMFTEHTPPVINKKRVRLLVDALRSGKYQQARGALRKDDAYCCLGVACDISGLGRWMSVQGFYRYIVGMSEAEGTLPAEVRDWYGFGLIDPIMTKVGEQRDISMSALNDTRKWTFEKIAAALEQEFLQEVEHGPTDAS